MSHYNCCHQKMAAFQKQFIDNVIEILFHTIVQFIIEQNIVYFGISTNF